MTDKQKTAENIIKYMALQNLSQSDVARKLKVSRQTVSLWVSGKSIPSREKLRLLAQLFHVTVSDILIEEPGFEPVSSPFQ